MGRGFVVVVRVLEHVVVAAVGGWQEGDPSSRKALLWMTANNGLGGGTGRLGEEDRSRIAIV
jgi:hypothetical protein